MAWNNKISESSWNPKNKITAKINSNYDWLNVNHISSGVIHSGEINTSTINALNIVGYNNYLDYIKNINIVTDVITLDSQGLTATSGGLFLNGELIATPGSISNVSHWARYPAISDVDIGFSSIKNVDNLHGSNLFFSNITGTNITGTNITGTNVFGSIGSFTYLDALQASFQNTITKTLLASNIISSNITNSRTISTSNLTAQTLNATQGTIITLTNTTLNSQTVNANTVNATTVNANTIQTNNFTSSNITASNASFSNVLANQINATTIYSRNIFTSTIFSPQIFTSSIIASSIIATNASLSNILANQINATDIFSRNIFTSTIFSPQIFTSSIMTSTIIADNGFFSNITASNIITSNVIAPNGTFDNIYSSNIYNSVDFQTNTATVNGAATFNSSVDINGYTKLNGGFETNGESYLNNTIGLNGDIVAGTNHSEIYGTQYLHSIKDIADINCKSLTINGGWTGDNFEPPFHYNTEVNIGTALTSPAIVTLNGENPNPLNLPNNLTTALLVRGDCTIDFGVFTCYNGANFYPVNFEANAISIYGTAYITGLANVLGNSFVGGTFETVGAGVIGGNLNVVGIFTSTGIAVLDGGSIITGPLTAQLGNIDFNSQVGGESYTFTNYGGTVLKNGVTLTGDAVFQNNLQVNQNVNIFNNLYVNGTTYLSNIVTSNIITKTARLDNILFNDLSGNIFAGIGGTEDTTLSIISSCNISIEASNHLLIKSFKDLKILAPELTLSNGSLTLNHIILNDSNITPYILVETSTGEPLGLIGRPDDDDELFFVRSGCNAVLRADNIMYVVGTNGIGLTSEVGIAIDGPTYLQRDVQALSTIFMNSNIITDLSNVGYVDYITNCNYPTYVGGQIQHWNPVDGIYDFNYSQLYYTDLANEAQDGVNGYSNHRAIAQDWSYYKCENLILDMNDNFITNCKSIYVNQATPTITGYIDGGVIFTPLLGDDYWWQLIKPQIPSYPIPGDEGIYILKRNIIDGAELAKGRLYDDTIYTPWANVTANLNMGLSSIIFKDQTILTDFGLNFCNSYLHYYTEGGGRYVAEDWSYFLAGHNVDLSGNNILNTNNLSVATINNSPYDATSNFAKYRAVSNLNMNNCNILNANNLSIVTINNNPYDATSNFAKYSAVSNLNMNNCNILNANNINLTSINGVAYSPFNKVTNASFTFSNITVASNTAVQNIINNCNIILEPNTFYQMNLAMNISNIPTANWNLVCRIVKTTVGVPIFYQLTAINPTFNYLCQGATGSFYTDDASNYTMRIFVGNTNTSNNITINRIVETIHKLP